MKLVSFLATSLLALSLAPTAFADRNPTYGTTVRAAQSLSYEAQDLARLLEREFGRYGECSDVIYDARTLAGTSDALADAARYGTSYEVNHHFDRVDRAYWDLLRSFEYAYINSYAAKRQLQQVERAFDRLQDTLYNSRPGRPGRPGNGGGQYCEYQGGRLVCLSH